jgi:hypothetical protein
MQRIFGLAGTSSCDWRKNPLTPGTTRLGCMRTVRRADDIKRIECEVNNEANKTSNILY